MNEIRAVYRSTHPLVAEFWEEVRRCCESFNEQCRELLAELPEGCEIVKQDGWGTRVVVGVQSSHSPGELWAKKRGDWFWSPVRKSVEGKKLAARLATIRRNDPREPGLPDMVASGMKLCGAHIEELNGVFWCSWGAVAEHVEASPAFDRAVWQRAKLSEYYAAKEAEEEARVAAVAA